MVNGSNCNCHELLSLGTLYPRPEGRMWSSWCKRWNGSSEMEVAFMTRCLLYRAERLGGHIPARVHHLCSFVLLILLLITYSYLVIT